MLYHSINNGGCGFLLLWFLFVRIFVEWVCFFISEFPFLFLLIFILFSRACLYMCNWCFPLRCLLQCLFVCLFVLLFYFVFISFLYLFIVYVMWLYFIIFSLKVYVALKWDYHILFVYWLIVYVVFLKKYRNIVLLFICFHF